MIQQGSLVAGLDALAGQGIAVSKEQKVKPGFCSRCQTLAAKYLRLVVCPGHFGDIFAVQAKRGRCTQARVLGQAHHEKCEGLHDKNRSGS